MQALLKKKLTYQKLVVRYKKRKTKTFSKIKKKRADNCHLAHTHFFYITFFVVLNSIKTFRL